jgi:hypothetical protein
MITSPKFAAVPLRLARRRCSARPQTDLTRHGSAVRPYGPGDRIVLVLAQNLERGLRCHATP